MTTNAIVTEILSGGMARVAVKPPPHCSRNCEKCGGCGGESRIITVEARNDIGAKPGQLVKVESSTGSVLGLAALLYILGPVMMIAIYFIAPGKESVKALLSILGLIAGFVLSGAISSRLKKRGKTEKVITAFCQPGEKLDQF